MMQEVVKFADLSDLEKDAAKHPRKQEKFEVRVNGFKCETITRKVTAHETHIKYGGGEYQIRGTGYARYISLTAESR